MDDTDTPTSTLRSWLCSWSTLLGDHPGSTPRFPAASSGRSASWTARILSGQLERRLLPAQRSELEPPLTILRRQPHDDGFLVEAVADGVGGRASD